MSTTYRQLSEDEFAETMIPPMRKLTAEEKAPSLDFRDCARDGLRALRPCMPEEGVDHALEHCRIQHVFVNATGEHTHVALHFGEKNVFVVIVMENAHPSILGFHILDLNAQHETN